MLKTIDTTAAAVAIEYFIFCIFQPNALHLFNATKCILLNFIRCALFDYEIIALHCVCSIDLMMRDFKRLSVWNGSGSFAFAPLHSLMCARALSLFVYSLLNFDIVFSAHFTC